jgi:hypothetical protein
VPLTPNVYSTCSFCEAPTPADELGDEGNRVAALETAGADAYDSSDERAEDERESACDVLAEAADAYDSTDERGEPVDVPTESCDPPYEVALELSDADVI